MLKKSFALCVALAVILSSGCVQLRPQASDCSEAVNFYLQKSWSLFAAEHEPMRSERAIKIGREAGVDVPIYSVKWPEINAIAFKDKIVVTELLLSKSDSFIRFVLAHEAAHVRHQHMLGGIVFSEQCEVENMELSPAVRQKYELDADFEAARTLQQRELFDAEAVRELFYRSGHSEADSHPLDSERFKALEKNGFL